MTYEITHDHAAGISILYEVSGDGLRLNCIVLEIRHYKDNDINVPNYESTNRHGNIYTENPANAKVFLKGTIKWDTCADWDLRSLDSFHTCNISDCQKISYAMSSCYVLASKYLKDWEGD